MADTETTIINQQIQTLLQRIDSLILSTLDEQGLPQSSLTPALWHRGCLFVLVSGLAAHTRPLAEGRVVGFLIAGEASSQAYARPRLSGQAQPDIVDLASDPDADALHHLEQHFGPIIQLLQGLPDFLLIRLRPLHARLVAGFGATWLLNPATLEPQHKLTPAGR